MSETNQKVQSIASKVILATWVLAVFLGLIRLGMWQWQKGEVKQAIILKKQDAEAASGSFLLDENNLVNSAPDRLLWRSVRLLGHFDAKRSIIWQNKFRGHRLGFEVLTPFYLNDGETVLMVNCGWVAANQSSNTDAIKKQMAVNAKATTAQGQLYQPERGVLLGENFGGGWPKTMQVWDLPELKHFYGQRLSPYLLRLDKTQAGGFNRDWPSGGMTPARHKMYAYQWWLFALVWLSGVVIYIRRSKDERE